MTGYANPPTLEFDVLRVPEQPAYVENGYEPGTFVFLLDWTNRGAGGIADMMSLGRHLEEVTGLRVFYHVISGQDPHDIYRNLQWANERLREEQVIPECSFVPEFYCATAWITAYRILKAPSRRKCYFVQDYDAWFWPFDARRHFAEKSHELGLNMFTLGPWLEHLIKDRHSPCNVSSFPFPMEDPPSPEPSSVRNSIVFYVQPHKPHRGTEILLETMKQVAGVIHERRLPYELVMFGSEDNLHLRLEFPCRVEGLLPSYEIDRLLGRTHVGVSISFTNISLMPFRFIAHGAYAVDIDVPNVTENVPQEFDGLMHVAEPHPDSLSRAIMSLMEQSPPDDAARRRVEEAYRRHSWRACAERVCKILNIHTDN